MKFVKMIFGVASAFLIGCCSVSCAEQKHTPISGTFISFTYGLHQNWDQARWSKEFEAMEKLKFDTLIVQAVAKRDPNSGKVISYYRSKAFKIDRLYVDWILSEAEKRGWKVYLGGFSDATGEDANKAKFVELNKRIANELYSAYKSCKSFAGFYISTEPLLNEADNAGDDVIYKVYVKYLKKKYPLKKVIVSPYFITDASARCKKQGMKQWWHNRSPDEMAQQVCAFLKKCPVDIIALQDSTCWDVTMADLRTYLPKIAESVRLAGKEFWVDMEVFDTRGHTLYEPASINRIMEQIEIEKEYKCVMYCFNWCMDPNGSEETKTLYNQYYDAYFK